MCRPFGTRLMNLAYPALPCRATGCSVPAGLRSFLAGPKVFCRLQTAGIFHALMALLSNERLIVRRGICRRGRHRLCWFRIWLARYCG